MTTLVVDGYNAIYAIPEVRSRLEESLQAAREAITVISREYARSSGYIDDVRVVFDGDDKYRYLDKFNVGRDPSQVFSRTGSGDEKIIEVVKRYAQKGKVILASNDNYVRNNARGYGAGLIRSDDLICGKRSKKKAPPRNNQKPGKSVRDEITRVYRRILGI